MALNLVFQEKEKLNVVVQARLKMSISELINVYYKKICASKKDKMTKKFEFQENEISPDERTLLSELGVKDYSIITVKTTDQMQSSPYIPSTKPALPKEDPPKEEQKENTNENKEKELIEENKKLKNKIKYLENIIIKLNEENKDMKNKLDNYDTLKEKIKYLENEINNKNNEIQNYILQIKNINDNKYEITSFLTGKEKIIVVIFMTQGNQDIINYAMACKNTDLFVKLEEKLYNDFPKYKNYQTFFKVDVRGILRFKTI